MTVDTEKKPAADVKDAKPEPKAKVEEKKAPEPKQDKFDADYVEKLRKENADYRTRAKANEDKAAKYDEQVEAGKSELQKATERASAAEKAVEKERVARIRAEVGRDKKLPAAMVDRLKGSTVEEMTADADAILADLGTAYVPKAGKSQGSTGAGRAGGGTDYESMDPAALVKMIREGHR